MRFFTRCRRPWVGGTRCRISALSQWSSWHGDSNGASRTIGPMRRLAFTLFSGIALLLCAATVVFWVRSYWLGEVWQHFDPLQGREYRLQTSRGQFSFYRVAFTTAPY